jgi:hypothetical protein
MPLSQAIQLQLTTTCAQAALTHSQQAASLEGHRLVRRLVARAASVCVVGAAAFRRDSIKDGETRTREWKDRQPHVAGVHSHSRSDSRSIGNPVGFEVFHFFNSLPRNHRPPNLAWPRE